jgi:CrcB protein
MTFTFFQVALGGALGATLRYATMLGATRILGAGFPVGTIFINILGSFIMGFLVIILDQRNWLSLYPFLMIGMLGGFTTFSAFSLDAYMLFEQDNIVGSVLYVTISVLFSITALLAGIWWGRYLII